MNKQQSGLGRPGAGQGKPVRQHRTSSTKQSQPDPQRTKHSVGLYPVGQPVRSRVVDQRTRHGLGAAAYEGVEEEEDEYDGTHRPTGSRKYQLPPQEYVIQQGNKRFVVHPGPPPIREQSLRPQQNLYYEEEEKPPPRRGHWLVFLGLFFIAVVAFAVVLISAGNWWAGVQEDWQYGKNPRTYQTDAVVGHGDSPQSPTHFIGMNLNGQIIVLEISRADPTKARRYNITTIENNAGNPPVKISFQDVDASGKLAMLVQIGDPSTGTAFTITLLNNGTEFVSKLK